MKHVLFVCGTGGITSAVAENRVIEACTAAGLNVQTKMCIRDSHQTERRMNSARNQSDN